MLKIKCIIQSTESQVKLKETMTKFYLVYYKYVVGFDYIRPEEIYEINRNPIQGIYSTKQDAFLNANKWNIKHNPDILEKSENSDIGDMVEIEYENILKQLYNKFQDDYPSNMEKYCMVKEIDI